MSLGSENTPMSPGHLDRETHSPGQWSSEHVTAFPKSDKGLYDNDIEFMEVIDKNDICGRQFRELALWELRDNLSDGGATSVEKYIEALNKLVDELGPFKYQLGGHRWERWQGIVRILIENKKTKAGGTLTWNDLEPIYKPLMKAITIEPVHIPEGILTSLHQILSKISREAGGGIFNVTNNDVVEWLSFISQIVDCMSILLNGEVVILAKEPMGDQFEFLMKRGTFRVCVIVAKKDEMDQGVAQGLLSCEAVANAQPSEDVFGLVTNYLDWVFLRSRDEVVEKDVTRLSVSGHEIEKAELAVIVGKLYAQLSGSAW